MTRTPLAWAARILAGGGMAAALVLTTGVGTASGATNTPNPGAVIVTFSVPATPGAAQTPTAVTHTINPTSDDERATVWAEMEAAQAVALATCGTVTYQIDLGAGPIWEAAQVGVPFPTEASSPLSAIPAFAGPGPCAETTTSTTAPPPTTTTAPPVAQDLTSSTVAPATVQDLTSDTVTPVVEAPATPEVPTPEVGITTAQLVSAHGDALPTTGADTGLLVTIGASFVAAGAGVLVLRRRLMA